MPEVPDEAESLQVVDLLDQAYRDGCVFSFASLDDLVKATLGEDTLRQEVRQAFQQFEPLQPEALYRVAFIRSDHRPDGTWCVGESADRHEGYLVVVWSNHSRYERERRRLRAHVVKKLSTAGLN